MTLNKSLDIVLEGTEIWWMHSQPNWNTHLCSILHFYIDPLCSCCFDTGCKHCWRKDRHTYPCSNLQYRITCFHFFLFWVYLNAAPRYFLTAKISAKHPDLFNMSSIRKKTIIAALTAGTVVVFQGIYFFIIPIHSILFQKKQWVGWFCYVPVVWAIASHYNDLLPGSIYTV